jgi:psp operon transcriptional activator
MRKPSDNIIGESLALNEALDHLSQLAVIPRPVLVLGERGTGKELAGERLHYLSERWDAPFIKVNCAAMVETLLESELFGHEAGAFTGATRQHTGRFERADGGTLFLDEIGTMSLRLQEKLLRLIEYGEFERVGGSRTLRVDVRVVGATNADLPAMARDNLFRPDLLDRLSFDVVHMPPLRERDDDILLLAQHFAMQLCAELGRPLFPGFTAGTEKQLSDYAWPGNVRELKNVVERSLYRWPDPESPIAELVIDPFAAPWADDGGVSIHSDGAPITRGQPSSSEPVEASASAEDVTGEPPINRDPGLPLDLKARVDEYEQNLLIRALDANGFHQGRTAESLSLTYDQLRGLLRKHEIRRPRRQA